MKEKLTKFPHCPRVRPGPSTVRLVPLASRVGAVIPAWGATTLGCVTRIRHLPL